MTTETRFARITTTDGGDQSSPLLIARAGDQVTVSHDPAHGRGYDWPLGEIEECLCAALLDDPEVREVRCETSEGDFVVALGEIVTPEAAR